jgi:sigma-E factor negative regulatory protein RseC
MEDLISHQGIVERIEDGIVSVKIVQHSACSGCKVKSMCSSAESKEKTVDVLTSKASDYKVGEEVMVYAGLSMGRTAVIIAFVIPSIIMVLWLIVALQFLKMGELPAIASVLLLLGVYYVILGMNKKRINRHFMFYIAKTGQN